MNSVYLRLLNEKRIDELKELLEEEVRKEGALRTNSKSRVNALKRIMKRNKDKSNLLGYGVKDGAYYFTDSYMYAVLNDNCGYSENEKFPVATLYSMDECMKRTRLYIRAEDLSYYVRIKENYKNEFLKYDGTPIEFNYNYIKDALDILGTKDELLIYTDQDKKMLILENNKHEHVVVLGMRVY